MKPYIPILIILLLVSTSFIGISYTTEELSTISFDGNTLYVGGSGPGNYTKIQDAIDNASDGDTVFVFNNSSPYYENLIVDKSINLIGEDKNTTVIDGSGNEERDIVHFYADFVKISGFTIQNGTYGIYIDDYNYNRIINNRISNNYNGIFVVKSSENIISENDILYNEGTGIQLLYSCSNNTIRENNIFNNYYSLRIESGEPPFRPCIDNKIYHNNFINNGRTNAIDDGNNTWDNGYPSGGNYWDYYNGKDKNGDGIGDNPYRIINPDNPDWGYWMEDRYPLMKPYNLTEPYLEIKINRIGFGVRICIKNVGNETAYDVNWNITTVGDYHRFTNIHKEGHSSLPLKTGEEKKFRLIPFGRGEPIEIKVIANAANAIESKKPGYGYIFLCFFILLYL